MSIQAEYDTEVKFPTSITAQFVEHGVALDAHRYCNGRRKGHCITFRTLGVRDTAKAAMQSFIELHMGGINIQFFAERDNPSHCYATFDVRGFGQ
jgi:hypothetical protein